MKNFHRQDRKDGQTGAPLLAVYREVNPWTSCWLTKLSDLGVIVGFRTPGPTTLSSARVPVSQN